CYQYSIGYTF
nr:immunoglobulin light chain junction region [Macaca mulatta]